MTLKVSAAAVLAIISLAICDARAAVQISSKQTKNMTCTGEVCTPTAQKAVLNVSELANMLASGDVTVQSGSVAQDIEIDAALNWTSPHDLTLDSFHSIAFNSPVTVAGEGGLTINTNDGGSGGDYRFFRKGHVEFWSSEGDGLIINHQRYFLADSMKSLARLVRRGNSGNYALMKSVNARTIYIEPPLKGFGGKFTGLGNTISHLTIHDSTSFRVGLFDDLDFALVRDLNLETVDIAATGSGQGVGAVSGGNVASTVQHVTVSGQISGGANSVVGGILGGSGGLIVDCSSSATITAADGAVVGGLVGRNGHDLSGPNVSNSFSTAALSNAGGAAGGVAGQSIHGGNVLDSYATGSVTGSASAPAGGLVGIRAADGGSVVTSYSTGTVGSGSGAPVGGSIGQDLAAGANSSVYWDLDTSGVSNPHQGAGNVADDPGITGLADAQLKSGLPAGFDPKIWAINPKINNGYPYLINNPPPK